jgi:tetratricopeptide (TPR) repeat protein
MEMLRTFGLVAAVGCLLWRPNVEGALVFAADDAPVASDSGLDEPVPEALEAKRPRGEAEADRLQAVALYSAARILEQKEAYASALRFYQRALRLDAGSLAIAREIVPLAFSLGRSAEAVRYALVAADIDGSDPALLERLAVHLTTQGEFERAISLYEKLETTKRSTPRDADDVILAAQMAKLYVVTGRYAAAARAYQTVMKGLDDKNSVVDSRTRRILVEDAAKTLDLLGVESGGRTHEAAAYDLFGLVMLEANDVDGARDAFDRAKKISSNPAIDAFQDAQVQLRRNEAQAALESLEAYFATGSTVRGIAPYELLGKTLEASGQSDQLIPRLESLRAKSPDNLPLGYSLAEQYRKASDLDKAQPLFESCLEARPAIQGYRALIDIYRQKRDADKLLNLLSQAMSLPRAATELGEEFAKLLADRELVAAVVERGGEALRDEARRFSLEQLLALAQFAHEAEAFAAADAFYAEALGRPDGDKPMIVRRWGLGLLLKDRYTQAAAVFRRAIEEKLSADDDAEFYFHLAGGLEMAGQTEEALVAARRGAELAESQKAELGDVYYRIVGRVPWVLYHSKRYAEAEAAYQRLLEKFDASFDNDAARDLMRESRLMLSNIAVASEKTADAVEWLEQILDEFPEDVSALNDLGYLWADRGEHLPRALAMIEKAVAADPKNAAYLDSHGWVLYRLGRVKEAIERLERAVNLEAEPDGVMLDHLGDAYAADGRQEEAQKAWSRAIEAFEKSGDADKIKAVQKKLLGPQATRRRAGALAVY